VQIKCHQTDQQATINAIYQGNAVKDVSHVNARLQLTHVNKTSSNFTSHSVNLFHSTDTNASEQKATLTHRQCKYITNYTPS
jgi:hypothetical protein